MILRTLRSAICLPYSTDMTCTDLVKSHVHVSLINLLKTVHDSEVRIANFFALLST